MILNAFAYIAHIAYVLYDVDKSLFNDYSDGQNSKEIDRVIQQWSKIMEGY
jgi:hypothetical protein